MGWEVCLKSQMKDLGWSRPVVWRFAYSNYQMRPSVPLWLSDCVSKCILLIIEVLCRRTHLAWHLFINFPDLFPSTSVRLFSIRNYCRNTDSGRKIPCFFYISDKKLIYLLSSCSFTLYSSSSKQPVSIWHVHSASIENNQIRRNISLRFLMRSFLMK